MLRPKRLRPCAEFVPSIDAESQEPAQSLTPAPSLEPATLQEPAPQQNCIPELGPGLKTFVINLARRPDRRSHIEAVCRELDLNFEIINAVDGQQLASLASSHLQVLTQCRKTKQPLRAGSKHPRGFSGIRTGRYCASWLDPATGKRRSQVLRMAEHRLRPTELTGHGHELWGAVGCNLSHQKVLRRIEQTPDLQWALVLEDDACLAVPSASQAREIFNQGMQHIAEHCPHWGVVHLGGHISSYGRNLRAVGNCLVQAVGVYQTHALVIRRCIVPQLLGQLRVGSAADAAIVNWARKAPGSWFLFHPKQLLQQPGGADRWKDSDIFVDGEFFKKQMQKQTGSEYSFNPERSFRPARPLVLREAGNVEVPETQTSLCTIWRARTLDNADALRQAPAMLLHHRETLKLEFGSELLTSLRAACAVTTHEAREILRQLTCSMKQELQQALEVLDRSLAKKLVVCKVALENAMNSIQSSQNPSSTSSLSREDLYILVGYDVQMGRILSTIIGSELLASVALQDLSLALPWLRELTEDVKRTKRDHEVVGSAMTALHALMMVGSPTSPKLPERHPKSRRKKAKPRCKLRIYGKLMQLSASDLRKKADLHSVCSVRMMFCVEKTEIVAAILESAAQRSERVSCNMRHVPPNEAG